MDRETAEFFQSINEQTIASSNLAMRTLVAINGGAAVAILAFVGSIAGKAEHCSGVELSRLTAPLIWFGFGVTSALASMMLAYLTNYATTGHTQSQPSSHHEARWGMAKNVFHLSAIVAALASLAFFVAGLFCTKSAIDMGFRV